MDTQNTPNISNASVPFHTLVDLIESFQNKEGDALIFHNGYRTIHLSYTELYERSAQASLYFRAQGIKKADRIALWGPNRPEWVVAYLGAIRIGAVLVPIDFGAHPTVARAISERAGVSFAVVSVFRKEKIAPQHTPLEDFFHIISTYNTKNISIAPETIRPDDLLEIVYTSGTTGDPKGVMLTHKNICTNLNDIKEHFKFPEGMRALSVLPLSHMLEQTAGLWTPLMLSGTIVYPHAVVTSALFGAFERFSITHMLVVPRLLQSIHQGVLFKAEQAGKKEKLLRILSHADRFPKWLKKILFKKIYKRFGPSFQCFVSGGAPLPPSTARFFRQIGLTVLEGYGLTECSPVLTATSYTIQKEGSVGKAFPGITLSLSPSGEILAKGESIFSGYYRDTQKTTEAFTHDGWYKTGDIGDIDEESFVFVRGRAKEMILTSAGMNVYPEDVEGVLLKQSEVKEVAVVGLPDGRGGEFVHAVVVLKEGADKFIFEIQRKANEELSSHSQIIGISLWGEDTLPKTTTLKVKRTQIKKVVMEKEGRESTTQKGESSSSNEHLFRIIAMVCGREASDIQESSQLVEDLHLDSLGRVELIATLAREYNYEIDESSITQNTTVGDIAFLLKERPRVEEKHSIPRFPYTPLGRVVRVTLSSLYASISALFARIRVVEGGEYLKDIEGPVIYIANHVSAGDQPIIFRALPLGRRGKLVTPTEHDYYFGDTSTVFKKLRGKFLFWYLSISVGAFMLRDPKQTRAPLAHIGHLLDQGESILLFPEGERGDEKDILAFKRGVGHIARMMQVPVVPIAHSGLQFVLPRGKLFPRFGEVTVLIGAPKYFTTEKDDDIRVSLENELRSLHQKAKEQNSYHSLY